MKLLERVEKKIFFRLVRSITFLVAFVALIATIAGLYSSVSNSVEAKPKKVQIQTNEIEQVLKPEAKSTADTIVSTTSNTNTTTEVTEPASEQQKIAESIAKKALAVVNIKINDSNYKESLEKMINIILKQISDYDHETQIVALTQLDDMTKSFPQDKNKFLSSIDIYFSLFKSKHEHEQALVDQKNAAAQASKTFGYSIVGGGIVVFALFVMILVLLRIEKNTRPESLETDEYDATDKKLLFGIVGSAIAIAILISWGLNKAYTNNEHFDPVSDLRTAYSSSVSTETPDTNEQPPVADQPSAQETNNYNQTSTVEAPTSADDTSSNYTPTPEESK
jgi:hypothetical protein